MYACIHTHVYIYILLIKVCMKMAAILRLMPTYRLYCFRARYTIPTHTCIGTSWLLLLPKVFNFLYILFFLQIYHALHTNTAIHQSQRPKEKRDYGTYRNPITKMSAPKLGQYLRLGAGNSLTDSLIVTLFDVNRSTYGRFSTFDLVSSSVLPSVVHGHGQCEDKTESLEGQVNRGTFGKLGTFDRGEPAGQLVNALTENIRIVPYKNAAATDKHCPKVLSIPKLVALWLWFAVQALCQLIINGILV